jgi:hypothetical protein
MLTKARGWDLETGQETYQPEEKIQPQPILATTKSLGYADNPTLVQQSLQLMTDKGEPFSSLEKWFLLKALQSHYAGADASWI